MTPFVSENLGPLAPLFIQQTVLRPGSVQVVESSVCDLEELTVCLGQRQFHHQARQDKRQCEKLGRGVRALWEPCAGASHRLKRLSWSIREAGPGLAEVGREGIPALTVSAKAGRCDRGGGLGRPGCMAELGVGGSSAGWDQGAKGPSGDWGAG